MACPDGIAPHLLQDPELPFGSSCIECGSKCTKVMVITHTLNLNSFTIQKKSVTGCEIKRSESEVGFNPVSNFRSRRNSGSRLGADASNACV